MAALELSVTKDWVRYYTSFFFASGDGAYRSVLRAAVLRTASTPSSTTPTLPVAVQLLDSEGIMLTSTGVNLTNLPASCPAFAATRKRAGELRQSGIYIFNAGADFNLTTKLTAFANSSYLRFDRTEPLEILLFQNPIRHSIGEDLGFGIRYRPPLSENIVVTAGESNLFPGAGLQNIYNSKVLLSGFASVALTF